MGILNVTPDSFSDGGALDSIQAVVAQGAAMAAAGARILDVGGESTRPGAEPVAEAEEIARVIPAVRALRDALPDIWLSVDTMKPAVMRAGLAAGADMINDVNALRAPGALDVIREAGASACVMHMQGEPRSMQVAPEYDDVLAQVCEALAERVQACVAAGISEARVVVDPGIGFGKSLDHNLTLLANLRPLCGVGAGIVIGASRKSLFGKLLDLPVDERLFPGLAVAAVAIWQGAHIIRTHDVAATVQAVRTASALRNAHQQPGAGST